MSSRRQSNIPLGGRYRQVSLYTDNLQQNPSTQMPLHWRHNDHDSVSNHQPHGCLLKRFFRRRSKKTSKVRVTGLCVGNSPGPVNSPHKGPVTRKMFPFDDVIMRIRGSSWRGDGGTKSKNELLESYSSHYVNHLVVVISSGGSCVRLTLPIDKHSFRGVVVYVIYQTVSICDKI